MDDESCRRNYTGTCSDKRHDHLQLKRELWSSSAGMNNTEYCYYAHEDGTIGDKSLLYNQLLSSQIFSGLPLGLGIFEVRTHVTFVVWWTHTPSVVKYSRQIIIYPFHSVLYLTIGQHSVVI